MTPLQLRISGKTLAAIAAILAALAAVASQLVTILPEDSKELILAFAAFLVALSAYLSHKQGV